MTTGTQVIAPFVPLDEFTATIGASELLLFCRDLRGTLVGTVVAAAGRALGAQPHEGSGLGGGDPGVGIAVETIGGTVVPVVRNALDAPLPAIRDEVSRLADAARAGRLAPGDLGAAVVTVCDPVALLGVAAADVRGPLLTVRSIGNDSAVVTLSLVVDGSDVRADVAQTFFAAVVRMLRHPYRLLV
jgi:pyruvate/2-oxoglutarate dehydrogenase complex dihydrolipoamide acyltransferase (E2) component